MFGLFLADEPRTPPPSDDFWYNPVPGKTVSGVDVHPEVALTYGAVWACTRVLTGAGGHLPLNLQQRTGDVVSVLSTHPVHRLLHWLPNPEMCSMGFRAYGLEQQINAGNFFAEIVRDVDGRPSELWPIHATRVRFHRATDVAAESLNVAPRSILWEIKNDNGSATWIPDADMFHVRSIISESNAIIGKGVIRQAREAIGHGIATQQQGAAFMKNSARPGIVITGGKFRNAEDRESFRRMWMAVHGGATNNAMPALAPEGATIDKLSFSPEDSQFLETLQHSVEEICRWYGVPPHLVQHLLRATYSNIEHQGIDFVVYSLLPWLVFWEQEIWRKLLSPDEQADNIYAKHVVEGLLRGDSISRAQFYRELWGMGALSINDIRRKEDLNPVDDGDNYFIQSGFVTLEAATSPPKEPAPQAEQQEPEEPEARNALRDVAITLIEDVVRRFGTKEINAATRMANKDPVSIRQWITSFYAEHASQLRDALSAPMAALGIVEYCDMSGDQLAEEICRSSSHQLHTLITEHESNWAGFEIKCKSLILSWNERSVRYDDGMVTIHYPEHY